MAPDLLANKHVNLLEPLPANAVRPLWTVLIPTYNCAAFTAETIRSVLQQDPGETIMQIEVVDDGSSDNIEEVVSMVGRDRVGFYRQPRNVGLIRNFETALQRSRGQFIHILHGDDRVLWGFYAEMGNLLQTYPDAGAAFCRHYFIDEHGHQNYISPLLQPVSGILPGFLELEARTNIVQTPSMVVRRSVYENLGMFDHRLAHSEDWEMWVRIAVQYPVIYCCKPLAEYRSFNQSRTMFTTNHQSGVDGELLVQSMVREHAGSRVSNLEKSHRAYFGSNAWYNIQKLYQSGNKTSAIKLLKRVLAMDLPVSVKLRLVRIFLKMEWQFRRGARKN